MHALRWYKKSGVSICNNILNNNNIDKDKYILNFLKYFKEKKKMKYTGISIETDHITPLKLSPFCNPQSLISNKFRKKWYISL